jgi:hypothetical protein
VNKENGCVIKDEEKTKGVRLLKDKEIEAVTGGGGDGSGGAGIGGGTPGSVGIISINGGSITLND